MTISDLTGGRSFRELLPFVLGGLLLIVVINIGVLLFVNRPRLAEAENADQTTAALATRVERTEQSVATLRAKVERLNRNKTALEDFFSQDLASKRERLVTIQQEIHRIAQQFQVSLNQLNFDHEPVEGTNLVRLGVTIPLTGGYNNLRQFIYNVENSEKFLIIEQVQLQEAEQGGALLNLNIRLASYFIDDDTVGKSFKLGG